MQAIARASKLNQKQRPVYNIFGVYGGGLEKLEKSGSDAQENDLSYVEDISDYRLV
jgi:hypothetical protein